MSDQQQNSYLGFEFWKKVSEVTIRLALNGTWFWRVTDTNNVAHFSQRYFQYAADAEQDLITFLKNKVI